MPRLTKAEQETIYRYDQEERVLWGYTAYAPLAARWKRMGWPVTEDGHGWRTKGPVNALTLRRLGPDGQIKKPRQMPIGRQFRAANRAPEQS